MSRLTAAEVKARFHLQPHPREGGCYRRSYEADELVDLPRYEGARRTGTAIYYLLEPGNFSEMHRLDSDEIFHFYGGGTVEMLQLAPGGEGRTVLLGADLSGEVWPQVVVPRGVWQGSRLLAGAPWALLGCTVSPGFKYDDYLAGTRLELCAEWPEWTETITDLTRE